MIGVPIVPTKYFDVIKDQPIQMCLYQEVLKSVTYANFFRQQKAQGKFIMLDNGAAEGVNPGIAELCKVYDLIEPNEVILPDVVGDMQETLKRTKEAYQYLVKRSYDKKFQFMAVPQGNTFAEWLECAEIMIKQPGIKTIGISKFVTQLFRNELGEKTNIRLECYENLAAITHRYNKSIEVHLLGCWEDLKELTQIEEAFPNQIRSTDSAIAFVCTRNGVKIDEELRPDQKEIEFQNNTDNIDMDLLQTNIKTYYNAVM